MKQAGNNNRTIFFRDANTGCTSRNETLQKRYKKYKNAFFQQTGVLFTPTECGHGQTREKAGTQDTVKTLATWLGELQIF